MYNGYEPEKGTSVNYFIKDGGVYAGCRDCRVETFLRHLSVPAKVIIITCEETD